jgi:DNA-binding transcriptional MerR regulator
VPHPLPQTEYRLYSVNDFLQRDDLVLQKDGLRRADYSDILKHNPHPQ